MSLFVSYMLALAATPAEVESVITRIREDFQLAGVDPSVVATQQAAAAAPAPVATGSDVDNTGLPWHADIHSGSKAFNSDGTWRKRKGVDAGTVARVEAQLRGAAPAPAATVPAPAAVATPATVSVPKIAIPGANVPKTRYQQFTDFLAENTAPAGKLNPAFLDAVFSENGTSIGALATADDETIQAFWDAIAGTLAG